jgi:hypothetical protein
MPQPARNDEVAEALVAEFEGAQRRLLAELQRIEAEPNQFRRRRMLRALVAQHEAEIAALRESSRTWWGTEVPVLHMAGAADFAATLTAGGFRTVGVSSPLHSAAIEQFTRRTWEDVAKRLRDIDEGTRQALRDLARSATRGVLFESRTATQGGRDFAREAAKRGIWSVRYADGSHHTMRDYADTVIRTTTATAYNEGAMTQAAVEGIEWIQYADGAGCGVTSHQDPVKANGMVVALDEVVALAHPRCRRALLPAPFGKPIAGADLMAGPSRAEEPAVVPARSARTPRTGRTPRGASSSSSRASRTPAPTG